MRRILKMAYDFKDSGADRRVKGSSKGSPVCGWPCKTVLSVIDKRSFIGQTVPAAETARHVIEPIEDYLREAAEGYGGEIKKLCQKNGVQSKTVITAGHPVEEILKEAEKSRANLIVMGSHGRSALGAAVLGSVAYGVIHKDTKIPALVVKR